MTDTHNKEPPKQQLLMIIETASDELTLMDGGGAKHLCKGPEEFWDTAKRLLHNDEAPALSSSPGEQTEPAKKADKQELKDAFGTLGQRLRDVAEAEYGAPVVDAASKIVGQATRKVSGVAQKHSRKGVSRRYSLRRRQRTG